MRHPKDKAESKYNPDAGISKEDEERYQKLVTENDELQKLIAQVSISIENNQSVMKSSLRVCFCVSPQFAERR